MRHNSSYLFNRTGSGVPKYDKLLSKVICGDLVSFFALSVSVLFHHSFDARVGISGRKSQGGFIFLAFIFMVWVVSISWIATGISLMILEMHVNRHLKFCQSLRWFIKFIGLGHGLVLVGLKHNYSKLIILIY